MGKLRALKDKMAHKEATDDKPDVSNEADDAFLHKTSHDTGADATHESRETHGKGVY